MNWLAIIFYVWGLLANYASDQEFIMYVTKFQKITAFNLTPTVWLNHRLFSITSMFRTITDD